MEERHKLQERSPRDSKKMEPESQEEKKRREENESGKVSDNEGKEGRKHQDQRRQVCRFGGEIRAASNFSIKTLRRSPEMKAGAVRSSQ